MTYAPVSTSFQGIPPERMNAFHKAELSAGEPLRHLVAGMEVSWVAASVVTNEWARQVFPNVPEQEAKSRLWELIFKSVRADCEDPAAEWKQHLDRLEERQHYMNGMQFTALRYQGPGTDLTVGLPSQHQWNSGATTKNRNGIPFVPNLPTEEIFTSPDRLKTNGIVRSAMPLNYNGRVIRDLTFQFENGRIEKATADLAPQDLAGALGLDVDEGARYLGEIALVPHESPIAQLNTLFYNSLFDENASCHLAFGDGFPSAVEGGAQMEKDEIAGRGVNSSNVHVDFMIGSAELDIDGIKPSGDIVPLFRSGTWVV
jgi:aminopeptidase